MLKGRSQKWLFWRKSSSLTHRVIRNKQRSLIRSCVVTGETRKTISRYDSIENNGFLAVPSQCCQICFFLDYPKLYYYVVYNVQDNLVCQVISKWV